jgi:RHS repeat-associated protein
MLRLHRWHLFFALVLLSGFVSFASPILAGVSVPIEGKGSVGGNAGAFTYSIPIEVPPGRQGLTPELALTYNSSGENGFLGVGWDLPIGYVMRSTENGVNYNCVSSAANSCFVFMLGGASSELIPRTDWCSDCYGAKIESGFVKFRFISNTYWQAIDKSGTKYFFGQTPASRQDNPADTTQVFKWELDTVIDTHNNTLTYAYFKDQGETYIDRVDYQANHIVFNYDNTRADKPTLYGPNFAVTTAYRLSGIDVYSNWNGSTGNLNRKYAFGYCGTTGVSCAASATGRSVLGKVTQYGSDGVTALPEMTFTPQNVEVNWTTPTWSGSSLSDAPIGDQCLSGDLDGNGKSDLWCQTTSGSGVWEVRLSTGAGWTSQSWSGPSPSFPISNQCFTGDLDGNGKIDFWCESGSGNGSWEVRLSTGTGWTPATWTGSVSNFPITGRCFTGDLQGDGKTDLWCQTGNASGSWYVWFSTGSGWSAPAVWLGPEPNLPVGHQCLTGDLNGDGRTDFWCRSAASSGSWKVAISQGTSWLISSSWSAAANPDLPVGNQCLTGDLNGDGKTDFWCQTGNSTGLWKVMFSTGSNWENATWSGPSPHFPVGEQCLIEDIDGDGKTDVLCDTPQNGGVWDVRLSTGSGWRATTLAGFAPPPLGTAAVTAGGSYTCSSLSDETVRCWGANASGQLGNGSIGSSSPLGEVVGISTATSISARESHSCVALSDGTIQCWGANGFGQLGIGSTNNSATPMEVSGISTAVAVSTGWNHTCAALSDGTVQCWGVNELGQLGIGWNGPQTCTFAPCSTTPLTVVGISTAVAVSAGWNHSCALLSDRTIRCWGANGSGQLGNGNTAHSFVPVGVSGISTAVAISAGESHSCAALSDGTIKCWGFNGSGQLGNGGFNNSTTPVGVSGISSAVAVSAGGSHTCATLSDKTLQCWGANASGQLGNGNNNGPQFCNSAPCSRTPVMVSGISTAVAVSAGASHNCAALSDGTLQCWGANTSGQLGIGSNGPQNCHSFIFQPCSTTPVAVRGIPASSVNNLCLTGDLNGDSKSDFWCYTSNSNWSVTLLNPGLSDLLTGISNGIGGRTTVVYQPSSAFWSSTDPGWNLPFINQNVSSVTLCDKYVGSSCTGNAMTTHYTYSGGYYNQTDHEFRGFSYVKATNAADNSTTETWFHQGNGTSVAADSGSDSPGYTNGLPYRSIVKDSAGVVRSQKDILYAADADGVAPYFTPIQQEDDWFCEAPGACKQTRSILTFDHANGNLTREDQYGDLSVTTDDRTITKSYSTNITAWILGLPTREILYQGIGTTTQMARTDFYYDGVTNCDTPSTNQVPTKGDLTRTVHWLLGGTSPESRMAYDTYGNLICAKDPNGNTTTISYDASSTFPKVVTNAVGHRTTTQYYGVDGVAADTGLYGQVKSVTDPNGTVTTTTYDSFGRRSRITLPNGLVKTFNYPCATATGCTPDPTNLFGNVGAQYVKESGGGLSSWTYFDGFGRTLAEESSGPGASIVRVDTSYNNLGQLSRRSLPYFFGGSSNGNLTYSYDAIGRLQQITHPDTSRTLYCYALWSTGTIDASNHMTWESKDAAGRLLTVYEYTGTFTACPAGPPAGGYATTNYQYNVLGNLTKVTDAKGNQTTMRYDTLGRKIAISDPDMGRCGDLTTLTPAAAYPWYPAPCWNYQYDAVGNLLRQTDAKNQTVTFSYDKLNRIKTKTDPDNKQVVYNYDNPAAGIYGIGRLRQIIDPSGSTGFAYDNMGRTRRVDKLFSENGTTNLLPNSGFETGGSWPDNWTRNGAAATFAWDGVVKRSGAKSISIANPTATAIVTGAFIPYSATKTYSASGWIKTANLTANAATLKMNFYDANKNRLASSPFSSSVGGNSNWTPVSYVINPGTAPAATAYITLTAEVSSATGAAWFDDLYLQSWYSINTGYDPLSRVTSLTYPDGKTVHYAYSGPFLDRIYEGTTTYARYGGYNALGQPGTLTTGNGVTTTYTYSNPANTTCPKQNFLPCTIAIGSFQTLTYGYDNGQLGIGNITSLANTANGNQSFVYDPLDRLTTATGPYGTGGATATLTYTYDQIGNMLSNSKVGAYTYPASGAASVRPHAVSTAGSNSYSYDANGNMISGAGRTINYNVDNRPSSITTAGGTTTFVYDGSGARVKKTVGAATTIYIGKLYECAGTTCSKYIFAGGQRIALKQVGSAEVYYYHTDHLGSSSVVTNAAGTKVQELAYFPYGQTRINSGTVDVHHKYTSQELDDSTGLYFYNARYYDPVLGRFIQADTIVPDSTDPQAFNRYSYVRNNPLKYTDPSGHGWAKKLKKKIKKAVKHAGWVVAPVAMAQYKAFHRLPENYQVRVIQAGSVAGSVACPACAPAIAAGAAMAMADINGGTTRDMLKAGAIGAAVGFVAGHAGSSVSGLVGGGLSGAIAGGAAGGFVGGAGTTLAAGGSLQQAIRAGYQGAAVGAGTAALMHGATQAVQAVRSQGEAGAFTGRATPVAEQQFGGSCYPPGTTCSLSGRITDAGNGNYRLELKGSYRGNVDLKGIYSASGDYTIDPGQINFPSVDHQANISTHCCYPSPPYASTPGGKLIPQVGYIDATHGDATVRIGGFNTEPN